MSCGPGSPGYSRFAIDTGGKLIKNTNDFTLGYATARRDLACRYTLGFYDKQVEEGRSHEIRVAIKRPGLSVSYPAGYAFRTASEKRESLIRAAFIAPSVFQKGIVRTHIFPLHPKDPRTWECMLVVDFPVTLDSQTSASTECEFGVVVRNGAKLSHTADRKMRIDRTKPGRSTRHVVFSEPVNLEPG